MQAITATDRVKLYPWGKAVLKVLGVPDLGSILCDGLLRLVIDLGPFQNFKFFVAPIFEAHCSREITNKLLKCDHNDPVDFDKLDHKRSSSVLLPHRDVHSVPENRKKSKLTVDAEFQKPSSISTTQSFTHLFNSKDVNL